MKPTRPSTRPNATAAISADSMSRLQEQTPAPCRSPLTRSGFSQTIHRETARSRNPSLTAIPGPQSKPAILARPHPRPAILDFVVVAKILQPCGVADHHALAPRLHKPLLGPCRKNPADGE